MKTYATINWQDGHIRLYPESRLDDADYRKITGTPYHFRWKRVIGAFEAPFSPYRFKLLQEMFGIETLEDDDTDLAKIAEERAERFEGYSDNASQRSQDAHTKVKNITAGIPFGQPILIGHHSERRHRAAAEKVQNGLHKAVEEHKKSEYWKSRAESALSRIKRKERPDAIYRRIQKLEMEQRGIERSDIMGEETKAAWRWFYEQRLECERALYQASGGIAADKLSFEVGGGVRYRHGHWYTIKRVNKKTVTIGDWFGPGRGEYKISLDDIGAAMSKAEWEAAEKVTTSTGWAVAGKGGE
jgi:hypothetical protein